MKKIILLLLISYSGFAQENEFTFSEKGFTDFVIKNFESKNKEELYKKIIDWVSVTYNDPKEVIKGEIVNDYIRIEGIKNGVKLGTILGLQTIDNFKYQIEISVKDNKYKFDVIKIQNYTIPSQYITGGWKDISISDTSFNYKNGKIKNQVKFIPVTLPLIFNELNDSLYNFIINNESNTKKNDW